MLLYALDVVPGHRRRGLGTALVTAFVDHARAAGCTEVWVLADRDDRAATATYAAAGGRQDPGPTTMFGWRLADGRHS
jgi:GNAT superfamily N-acetyltransferase